MKVDRVKEVIALNEKGKEVEDLKGFSFIEEIDIEPSFENVFGQDDLTRFDRKGGDKRKKKRKPKPGGKNRNKPRTQSKEIKGKKG